MKTSLVFLCVLAGWGSCYAGQNQIPPKGEPLATEASASLKHSPLFTAPTNLRQEPAGRRELIFHPFSSEGGLLRLRDASPPPSETPTQPLTLSSAESHNAPPQSRDRLVQTWSDTMSDDLSFQLYRMLDVGGYLDRPPAKSDTWFERAVVNVWEPEVYHLGKKTVSCSILTAVKRKNPLCLLSPLVFHFSW